MTEPRRLGQTITEFERFLEATIRSGLRTSLLNSTDHGDAWLIDVRVEAHGKHDDEVAHVVHEASIYHSSDASTSVTAFLRDLADEIDGGALAIVQRRGPLGAPPED
ncbi:MAG: hypothetical protein WC558_08830 [Patulibacter sp.]